MKQGEANKQPILAMETNVPVWIVRYLPWMALLHMIRTRIALPVRTRFHRVVWEIDRRFERFASHWPVFVGVLSDLGCNPGWLLREMPDIDHSREWGTGGENAHCVGQYPS